MSRLALVTGGQTGIGLGIVQALVEAKFKVAVASSSEASNPEVSQLISGLDDDVGYYQFDLAQSNPSELLTQIQAKQGAITTVILNAGIASPQRGDMLEVSPEAFEKVMAVNLQGNFFLAQAAAQQMETKPSEVYRAIVFITSVSAEIVSIERAEYCISKAAASMMAKLYATRLAPANIGVFEVRPGIIATRITAKVKDRYDRKIAEGLVPAARWGQPADIASIVTPLVSGEFQFATGSVINVDGGLAIHRL